MEKGKSKKYVFGKFFCCELVWVFSILSNHNVFCWHLSCYWPNHNKPYNQRKNPWPTWNLTYMKPDLHETWRIWNLTYLKPDLFEIWPTWNLTYVKPDLFEIWNLRILTYRKPEINLILPADLNLSEKIWLLLEGTKKFP